MTKANDGGGLACVRADADDLVSRLEELTQAGLDLLPFGVIRLDNAGKVTFFSETEAKQSGFLRATAAGLDFFTELAPCMSAHDFRARVERAAQSGKLDIQFEQVGDFADEARELRVRMASATGGGFWIAIERDRAAGPPRAISAGQK